MSHAPATGTRFAFTYCAVLQSGCSRSAKAPLGAAHRCAPCRVYKTHNMQSALRWGWAPQPSALPGRLRALRAAAWSPCQWRGPLASVGRCAQGSGQWPAARCNGNDYACPFRAGATLPRDAQRTRLLGVTESPPPLPSLASRNINHRAGRNSQRFLMRSLSRRLLWHDAEAIPPAYAVGRHCK